MTRSSLKDSFTRSLREAAGRGTEPGVASSSVAPPLEVQAVRHGWNLAHADDADQHVKCLLVAAEANEWLLHLLRNPDVVVNEADRAALVERALNSGIELEEANGPLSGEEFFIWVKELANASLSG